MPEDKKVCISRGKYGLVRRDIFGQPLLNGSAWSDVKLRDTLNTYMERRQLVSKASTPKQLASRIINGRKNYRIAIGLLKSDLSAIGYDFNEVFTRQSFTDFSELIPHRPTTHNIKKLRDSINTQFSFGD